MCFASATETEWRAEKIGASAGLSLDLKSLSEIRSCCRQTDYQPKQMLDKKIPLCWNWEEDSNDSESIWMFDRLTWIILHLPYFLPIGMAQKLLILNVIQEVTHAHCPKHSHNSSAARCIRPMFFWLNFVKRLQSKTPLAHLYIEAGKQHQILPKMNQDDW